VRTRALFASVTASAGLLVGGWQLGAQAVPAAVAISDTSSTPSTGTTSSSGSGTTSGTTGSGTTGSGATGSGASGTTDTGTTSGSAAASPTPAAQEPASGQAASGTYTGSTATERFGTVAVKVTVAGGKITDVSADMTARDSRSQQINTRAAALLRTEVLSAQSADVTMISGATYTSDAYLTSLQAALDQAGL
jgi:uncharacterized protein with FMN-binding domain